MTKRPRKNNSKAMTRSRIKKKDTAAPALSGNAEVREVVLEAHQHQLEFSAARRRDGVARNAVRALSSAPNRGQVRSRGSGPSRGGAPHRGGGPCRSDGRNLGGDPSLGEDPNRSSDPSRGDVPNRGGGKSPAAALRRGAVPSRGGVPSLGDVPSRGDAPDPNRGGAAPAAAADRNPRGPWPCAGRCPITLGVRAPSLPGPWAPGHPADRGCRVGAWRGQRWTLTRSLGQLPVSNYLANSARPCHGSISLRTRSAVASQLSSRASSRRRSAEHSSTKSVMKPCGSSRRAPTDRSRGRQRGW